MVMCLSYFIKETQISTLDLPT